jgi:hypothetical protein
VLEGDKTIALVFPRCNSFVSGEPTTTTQDVVFDKASRSGSKSAGSKGYGGGECVFF